MYVVVICRPYVITCNFEFIIVLHRKMCTQIIHNIKNMFNRTGLDLYVE